MCDRLRRPPAVLGIEPRGKRGRADEIDNHHGEMTAFGGVGRRLLGGGGRLRRGRRLLLEFANRAQDFQPVAERNAEVLEVLIRQFRQDVAVDLVLTKDGLVLTETEPAEPIADLHNRFPIRQGNDGQSEIPCLPDHLPLRRRFPAPA